MNLFPAIGMNCNLYHCLPIVYGILLASVNGYCEGNLDEKVGSLETEMRKIRAETAYGNFGPRTASANAQIDGIGFFATADLLWWKLYEGSTDYLLKAKNSRAAFPIQGDIKHFNFDWEPGFRIGGGYLFEHDGWEADIEFTYFKSHAHNSSSSMHLFPLVGNGALNLAKSKGHWNVDFYDIDFIIGRNYFVSKCLSLNPFFGIASAWIDQHRRFHFVTDTQENVILKGDNDFWGIGPRLGLGAQFAFTPSFSFYGQVSGNLLWGDFHVKERERNNTLSLEYYDLHSNFHRMVPNGAFGLGIAYETIFAEDAYRFMIKGGYENQYWWRQNQLPFFDINSMEFYRASDDLSIQGFTVELRLDF